MKGCDLKRTSNVLRRLILIFSEVTLWPWWRWGGHFSIFFSEPEGRSVKAGMSDYQVTLSGEPRRQHKQSAGQGLACMQSMDRPWPETMRKWSLLQSCMAGFGFEMKQPELSAEGERDVSNMDKSRKLKNKITCSIFCRELDDKEAAAPQTEVWTSWTKVLMRTSFSVLGNCKECTWGEGAFQDRHVCAWCRMKV